MEFTLSSRTRGLLIQIREAIFQLKDWNKGIHCSDDYYCSPDGMKNLAASCMLIEAIGEGIKQVDKATEGKLLPQFGIRIVYKKVGSLTNILYLYR